MMMTTPTTGHEGSSPRTTQFSPETAVQSDFGADPSRTTSDTGNRLYGRIFPSREAVLGNPDPHDRLACIFPEAPAEVIALGVQAVAEALSLDGATAALIGRLATAEEKLSDAEGAVAAGDAVRDHLDKRVQALSDVRVFVAAGVIEADLAERYESLRTSFDAVTAERDKLRAILDEEVDVTKPRDVRGDALLSITVLSRFAEDGDAFTAGDARRVRGNLRRLLVDRDGIAQDCRGAEEAHDALALKVADLTVERDTAAENARRERDQHAETVRSLDWVQEAFERREVDISRWGTQRGEVARRWVEDLKAKVERERNRRGTYNFDTLKDCDDDLLESLRLLGTDDLLSPNGDGGPRKRGAIAETILRRAGLRTEREEKPRCRVVTSPRFYSDEQREWAAKAFHDDALGANDHTFDAPRPLIDTTREWCFEVVDCVAEALGMRRSAA